MILKSFRLIVASARGNGIQGVRNPIFKPKKSNFDAFWALVSGAGGVPGDRIREG